MFQPTAEMDLSVLFQPHFAVRETLVPDGFDEMVLTKFAQEELETWVLQRRIITLDAVRLVALGDKGPERLTSTVGPLGAGQASHRTLLRL